MQKVNKINHQSNNKSFDLIIDKDQNINYLFLVFEASNKVNYKIKKVVDTLEISLFKRKILLNDSHLTPFF